MWNKFTFAVAILSCLCTFVFSEEHSINKAMIDNFINCSFWFQKYLPLEYIPNYDLLREMLVEASTANEFERTANDLFTEINNFNSMAFERLECEIVMKDEKMNLLNGRYPQEVQDLDSQYSTFKAAIEKRNFPHDDACLDYIDEYYSRLIIRLGFSGNDGRGTNVYETKKGDYFRKIAKMFYGNEREWERIFEANKSNKKLLPYPDNPDLIFPNVQIIVP
jgi:nucleoid-associated protein YgaU